MPILYRLANPGITSVSVDGREHAVADGLLRIEAALATPALLREITGHFGGVEQPQGDPPPDPKALAIDEEAERQGLLDRLPALLGKPVDRRRTLAQLRKMLADHEARQERLPAESAGA